MMLYGLLTNSDIFSVTDYPSSNVDTTCVGHIRGICLLFSRKQHQIFGTCCWHYQIRNQCTSLPQYVTLKPRIWDEPSLEFVYLIGRIQHFPYLWYLVRSRPKSELIVPSYLSNNVEITILRHFSTNSLYSLVVNESTNHLSYVVDSSSYFGISVFDYPSRTVGNHVSGKYCWNLLTF